MSDTDPTDESLIDPVADDRADTGASRRSDTSTARNRRWSRSEVIAGVIAALLAVGVVVLALDMKFEADQARWQQRQTCLEWYRLQADYAVGPWYQKLPTAAADCGGGVNDDGNPTVPGGNAPAVEPGENRYEPSE